jgi:predicted dehydrogenase
MAVVRAAVVGTGFIGPVHVEALRRAGVEVVGVLGSSPAKSRQAAAALGVPVGYADLAALLADRAVQAVHLASPNRLHFAQAGAVLESGRHCVCEKPLAMNSRESAALVKIARASGKVAAVNYNVRYYPLCLEARERVRRGDLGRVHHVVGGYWQDWLLHETDFNWRVLAGEGGATRAVGDIGTHWMDLIGFVCGLEIEAVLAELRTCLPTRIRPAGSVETFTGKLRTAAAGRRVSITTEDFGAVMLRFAGGAVGVLTVSQVCAGKKNSCHFTVAGSKASLSWDSERPEELEIGRRDGPNEVLVKDPSLLSEPARRHANYPGGHAEGFPDTFKQLYRAIYDYIAAGDITAPPTFPTFADGHREIVLCEAIVRSSRAGKWVKVKPV